MYNTENIKKLRIELGKSQSEIAKLIGVGRSSYAMWESNNNTFPIKRLISLCNTLNISLDYALGISSKNIKIDKDIDLDKFKIRIKEFRKNNNITQEKLAKFLKIDQPTWSIYESGKSLIGTPFLYMICKKYGISADYLFGRTNKQIYYK